MVACEAMAAAQQQFEAMSCVDIDGELAGAGAYAAGDEFLIYQDPRDPHAPVYARMPPFQTAGGFPRDMDMDMDVLVSSQQCCYPCYMDCCYSTTVPPPPLQVPGRPIGSLSPSLTDELHFSCSGELSAGTAAPQLLHGAAEQHRHQDDDLAAFTDATGALPPLYFSQEVADREPSPSPGAPAPDASDSTAASAVEDPGSQEERLPTSSPAQQEEVMSSPSAVDPLDKLPMYPHQQQLNHHHQAAGMYSTPLANTSYLSLPIEYAYAEFYLQPQQQQEHRSQHHHQFAIPPPPCQVHRTRTFHDDFALHSTTASVPPAMHPARRRHSVATPYDLSCLAGFADPMAAAAAAAAEGFYQPSTTAYEMSNGAFYAY
ncbi:hypothetical protein HDU87_000444 [Geranomyces variabilis]|uniref:Uncharacterized protein n=1 Tax=Geranomyces variabilis TaxID=109894 RepID=A0AAD5TPA7_9FUNG|nr:hypothetical protein HDU87_000444 [Geranomyces variabilis]